MLANWTEKRRTPRVNIKVPLRYQIRGKPEFNNAISADISSGGISFVNNKFVAPNNYLNIEISFFAQVINTAAKVIRADSLPHSDNYRLGVEFLELDYRQKQRLSGYITEQSKGFSRFSGYSS